MCSETLKHGNHSTISILICIKSWSCIHQIKPNAQPVSLFSAIIYSISLDPSVSTFLLGREYEWLHKAPNRGAGFLLDPHGEAYETNFGLLWGFSFHLPWQKVSVWCTGTCSVAGALWVSPRCLFPWLLVLATHKLGTTVQYLPFALLKCTLTSIFLRWGYHYHQSLPILRLLLFLVERTVLCLLSLIRLLSLCLFYDLQTVRNILHFQHLPVPSPLLFSGI